MAVTIPITRNSGEDPFFDLQVVLDGETYTLEFRWNVRLAAWFMTVYDSEGETALIPDQRLVVDYPLGTFISSRKPTGVFVALDTHGVFGEGEDPDFDDLGNRVQLLYVSASELG